MLTSLLKLYTIIAQKESRLNLLMAAEQRKLAHASKRDSSTMKTISLLGSIFLPGAYLAVSHIMHVKLLSQLSCKVDIFNDVLQFPEFARYPLGSLPEFLALLGCNDTINVACCRNLDMVGKEARGEVR